MVLIMQIDSPYMQLTFMLLIILYKGPCMANKPSPKSNLFPHKSTEK